MVCQSGTFYTADAVWLEIADTAGYNQWFDGLTMSGLVGS